MQEDYCPVAMTLEHPEMLTGNRDGQMLTTIKLTFNDFYALKLNKGSVVKYVLLGCLEYYFP